MQPSLAIVQATFEDKLHIHRPTLYDLFPQEFQDLSAFKLNPCTGRGRLNGLFKGVPEKLF